MIPESEHHSLSSHQRPQWMDLSPVAQIQILGPHAKPTADGIVFECPVSTCTKTSTTRQNLERHIEEYHFQSDSSYA